jgi:hypothetical protein
MNEKKIYVKDLGHAARWECLRFFFLLSFH